MKETTTITGRALPGLLLGCLFLAACGTESGEGAADAGARTDTTESATGGTQDGTTGGTDEVTPAPKDNPGVEVTYLANAGFLLTGPEGNVLIDSLFSDPQQPWRAHSGQTLDALTTPRKPFDAVDVVIVTHDHDDHYDAETVAKHLRGNPEAQLITTEQVGADLAEKLPDHAQLEARIHAQTPNSDQRIELDVAGIHFTLLHFTHGPNSTSQNMGVLFELGGTKILHVGDSLAHLPDVEAYALPDEHIDVLFVPYWKLMRPFFQETIRTGIAPGTIVGMHFEPSNVLQKHVMERGGWESFFEMLQTEFPELVIIEEPASKVHLR